MKRLGDHIRSHMELTMDEEAEVVEIDHSIQRVPEEVTPQEYRSDRLRTSLENEELTRKRQLQSRPPAHPSQTVYRP